VRATGDQELHKQIDEGEREHAGVKEKVARARTLLGNDAELEETMTAIQGDVDHHVREEEHEMFPRLRDVMSEHLRDEIGRRFASRKRGRRAPAAVRVVPPRASAARAPPDASAGRSRALLSGKRRRGGRRRRRSARSVTARSAAGRRKTRATAKRSRR
jgi:hypothetical protein